jgi:O-methyltransferase
MAAGLAQVRSRARSRLEDVRSSRTARQVRRRRLTYLSAGKLAGIEACLRRIRRAGVAGDFVETGVALGGSAVVIARHLDAGRAFHGYDVFGMIPPPGEADPREVHERYATIRAGGSAGIGGDRYYGYRQDLLEEVRGTLAGFGVPVDGERVHLHRGLFEDTLRLDGPVAFAHLDCDWYDPVELCLARVYPRLSPGGCMVVDDYYDYGGARRATHEFLSRAPDIQVDPISPGRHLVLRRL